VDPLSISCGLSSPVEPFCGVQKETISHRDTCR